MTLAVVRQMARFNAVEASGMTQTEKCSVALYQIRECIRLVLSVFSSIVVLTAALPFGLRRALKPVRVQLAPRTLAATWPTIALAAAVLPTTWATLNAAEVTCFSRSTLAAVHWILVLDFSLMNGVPLST